MFLGRPEDGRGSPLGNLSDVNALSAVPYCAGSGRSGSEFHHLRQAGLEEQFNATLMSDIRDLPSVLVNTT